MNVVKKKKKCKKEIKLKYSDLDRHNFTMNWFLKNRRNDIDESFIYLIITLKLIGVTHNFGRHILYAISNTN